MRKLIYVLTASLLLGACSLETSHNGDLDGFWQLHHADTLATGGSADMRDSKLYWAVQMHLLRVLKTDYGAVFFRFNNTGDSLLLSDPYLDNRDSSDIKVTDASLLLPYGFSSLSEGYVIEQLDADKMVLKSRVVRLHFRKY